MLLALSLLALNAAGDRPFTQAVPERARQVLNEANFVEVFRLGEEANLGPGEFDKDLWRRTQGSGFGIARYPVLGMTYADAPLAAKVRATLQRTFTSRWTKMCGPIRPGVAYRFHAPGGFVEVLFCFHCLEADLVMEGQSLRLQLDGLLTDLVPLVLESFPLDSGIAEFIGKDDEPSIHIPYRRDYRPPLFGKIPQMDE